jgi:hypothetical protein
VPSIEQLSLERADLFVPSPQLLDETGRLLRVRLGGHL